jgi:quinol monooxygenase YgiN
MIFVIAAIEVRPGRRNAFLVEFKKLVPTVRAEQGCVEYLPTVDVATGIAGQGEARADVVTVVERWESVETLKAHLSAPHMLEFRERVKDLTVGTTLRIVESA